MRYRRAKGDIWYGYGGLEALLVLDDLNLPGGV